MGLLVAGEVDGFMLPRSSVSLIVKTHFRHINDYGAEAPRTTPPMFLHWSAIVVSVVSIFGSCDLPSQVSPLIKPSIEKPSVISIFADRLGGLEWNHRVHNLSRTSFRLSSETGMSWPGTKKPMVLIFHDLWGISWQNSIFSNAITFSRTIWGESSWQRVKEVGLRPGNPEKYGVRLSNYTLPRRVAAGLITSSTFFLFSFFFFFFSFEKRRWEITFSKINNDARWWISSNPY
jgi:hypothetical protein